MSDSETIAHVHAEARAAWSAGVNVVAPTEDGEKRPDLPSWREFQRKRVSLEVLKRWYPGRTGLGALCGRLTDDPDLAAATLPGLEAMDFDDRAVYEGFVESAEACGLLGLVEWIEDGYCDDTPGGGVRWLYRCSEIAGNTKLAQRLKPPEARTHPEDKLETLIETRGQGGYAVLAPSNGRVHPSGGAYTRRSGGFDRIRTLTPEQRTGIFGLARTFHEVPAAPPIQPAPTSTDRAGSRPGDDFNGRASWDDVLAVRGWTRLHTRGDGVTYWRRPGKAAGFSATTNYGGSDRLCVFSTSTCFETAPGKSYDKFGAYAVLEHGGDLQAAARALAALGYGAFVCPSDDQSIRCGQSASAAAPLALRPVVGLSPTDAPFPWSPPEGLLEDYVSLWKPTTDAPGVYHVAAGLAVISTVVNNRIWLPYGGERLLTNLFQLILGPSSFFRKTTAINKARTTVRWLHDGDANDTSCPLLPDEFSREALLKRLSEQAQGLLTFSEFSGALATFSRDYMSGTRELLADLYDSPPVYTRLVGTQTFTLRHTCLSILAASQTDWLLEKLKANDMRGGFMARFAMWPAFSKETFLALPPEPNHEVRGRLVLGLNELRQLRGEVTLHRDSRARYTAWLERHERELHGSSRIADLSPFWSRLAVMALKFAVLLEVAAPDHTLTVSPDHMDAALGLTEWLKSGLHRLFAEEFAFTEDMRNRQKVLRIIRARPGIKQRDLLRASSLLLAKLTPIVQTLVAENTVALGDGGYWPAVSEVSAGCQ